MLYIIDKSHGMFKDILLYVILVYFLTVSEIWDAFAHMSSEAFRLKYNFEKPDQSTRLGLNCLKGRVCERMSC